MGLNAKPQSQPRYSYSNRHSGWAYGGTISEDDVHAFKRKLESLLTEAYATSNGSTLKAFFRMFYSDDGRYIDASTAFYAATGKRQIADRKIEEIYRGYFHRMAKHIWFIGDQSSTALLRFEKDFAGEDFSTGIVRHMMSMYDRVEESNVTAMFTVNKKDTEEFAKASVGDLIGIIYPICLFSTPLCVKDLAFQMDDRAPKIYKILNPEDADYFVELIDHALGSGYHIPRFSADYFRLFRIRNNIAALNHNFFMRAFSCASLLTTSAASEIRVRNSARKARKEDAK